MSNSLFTIRFVKHFVGGVLDGIDFEETMQRVTARDVNLTYKLMQEKTLIEPGRHLGGQDYLITKVISVKPYHLPV